MRYRALFLVVVGFLVCSLAYADVPKLINFQGRLTDASGKFVPDGNYSVTFRIYTAPTGGTAKWTETQSVAVSKGLFNVILSSVIPIPDGIFSYPNTWLGIKVGTDPEMTPRTQIVPVAYAHYAEKADTAAFAKAGVGGGGWVDDGEVVRLATNSDKVGVGPFNPTVPFEVNGVTDIGGGTLVSARLGHGFNHWTYFGDGNSGRIRGSGEGYLYLSNNPNGTGDKRIYLDASGSTIVCYGSITEVGTDFRMTAGADRGPGGRALVHGWDNTLYINFEGDFWGGTTVGGPVLRTNVLAITGGSDLAEPFPISYSKELQPGSAVVIDEENPGHLTLSTRAYDRRVAGIVSGAGGIKPGLTLSQQGVMEGDQNIALSGRVYVLGTASNGAIKPGDLLTTSETPGYVMKVTDYEKAHGAVIGKAMSSLEEGQGLVLVLVNLQ